jgi:hypothetical protein
LSEKSQKKLAELFAKYTGLSEIKNADKKEKVIKKILKKAKKLESKLTKAESPEIKKRDKKAAKKDKKEVVKKEKKSVVFNEQDNEVIIGTERKWNDAKGNKAAFV